MSLVVAQVKGPAGFTARPDSKAGDESRTHDSHVGNVIVSSITLYIAMSCKKCISKVTNLVLQGSKFGRTQSQNVIHWRSYGMASNYKSDIFRLCQFQTHPRINGGRGPILRELFMQLS